MNHGLGQYVSVQWCAVCGARVRTSASWLSDAHASLRLHGMMREGIRHIVLSPLLTWTLERAKLTQFEIEKELDFKL